MGGLALLPWEKWAARLLHSIAVAVARQTSRLRRWWALSRSEGWPEVSGTVEQVSWDSSWPRDEIAYSYCAQGTSYSGYYYAWFSDRSSVVGQLREGNKVLVRHKPDDPGESVFVRLAPASTEQSFIGAENR
ncbi:MAG: DUF3592 domain-containing protein [Terriglobales bacterium]